MKKTKLFSLISTLPLIIVPIATTSCASNYLPSTNFTKVHEFINDRIFSVVDLNFTTGEGVFGTLWLFAKVANAENNYTYYGLTNNHVTSGFNDLQHTPRSHAGFGVYLGCQDKDSAGSTDQLIPFSSLKNDPKSGNANKYSLIDKTTDSTLSGYTKFEPLFTTYIKDKVSISGYSYTRNYYRDMTIVKVDLSEYQNKSYLGTRLEKLNTYAANHDNMLVQFDDYSDITSDIRSSIYAGGFPVNYMDSNQGSIYPSAIKFQSMKFDNCSATIYKSMTDLCNVAHTESTYSSDAVYNALNEFDNTGSLFSADWEGPFVTDRRTPFGGGASGSMAIRCTNEDDPETYKVTGIYWGGTVTTSGSWYFQPHFSPFTLNFGKNMPTGSYTWNIIDAFKASAAYTTATPTNYAMYVEQ